MSLGARRQAPERMVSGRGGRSPSVRGQGIQAGPRKQRNLLGEQMHPTGPKKRRRGEAGGEGCTLRAGEREGSRTDDKGADPLRDKDTQGRPGGYERVDDQDR